MMIKQNHKNKKKDIKLVIVWEKVSLFVLVDKDEALNAQNKRSPPEKLRKTNKLVKKKIM